MHPVKQYLKDVFEKNHDFYLDDDYFWLYDIDILISLNMSVPSEILMRKIDHINDFCIIIEVVELIDDILYFTVEDGMLCLKCKVKFRTNEYMNYTCYTFDFNSEV